MKAVAAAPAPDRAATANGPAHLLWQATLAQLSELPASLDPFLGLEVWDRRPTMRAITHVALLVSLTASGPHEDHPALRALTAFLSDFVHDPRLPRLLDRKLGELPYLLWLASLLEEREGAGDLAGALSSRLRHRHAAVVERTAHGRFLLAWHLRAREMEMELDAPAETLANRAGELASFRRHARFRAGLDDALEVFELSVLVAAARSRGAHWQRHLVASPPLAGLDEVVELALAVLVRGDDAVSLAALLASASLLDAAPPALRRLASSRLSALWLQRTGATGRRDDGVGSAGTVVAIAARLADTLQ